MAYAKPPPAAPPKTAGRKQEILAVGGWSSDKAAAPYLRDVNKAKLSKSGTDKVVAFEAVRAAANG